jgi:hypothetical protein
MALEYADRGLVAYCVNPGAIKTSLASNMLRAVLERLPDKPDGSGRYDRVVGGGEEGVVGWEVCELYVGYGGVGGEEGGGCGERFVEGEDGVLRWGRDGRAV